MQTLQVNCPSCSHSYTIDGQLSGRRGRCKYCGVTFDLIAEGDGRSPASPTQQSTVATCVSRGAVSSRIGRFEIREKLGSGGFGAVYRAYDPVLDREVALKVPHDESLDDPQAEQRFVREAKAAAQLFHPHIVPVFDSGTDGQQHYIASAYIPGQTLAEAIKVSPFEPEAPPGSSCNWPMR